MRMAPLAGERAKRPRWGVFAMRPPQSKVSGKRAMPAQTITYATGAGLEPFCALRKTLVRAARSALAKITHYNKTYIQDKKNPPDWVGMRVYYKISFLKRFSIVCRTISIFS